MLFRNKNDIIGDALINYYRGDTSSEIILHSYSKVDKHNIIKSKEVVPISLFFRNISDLSKIEHLTIDECYGKVLDIGAGAGVHSIILMNKGIDVHSIDLSKGAVHVMKERGLKNVYHGDIKKYNYEDFDTLVFFGNNHGLFGDIHCFNVFLKSSYNLIKPSGQILISSPYVKIPILDINKESYLKNFNYIELKMCIQYYKRKSKLFNWFMAEPNYIKMLAESCGWLIDIKHNDENACLIRFYK